MSEYSNTKARRFSQVFVLSLSLFFKHASQNRGAFIAAVFAMQGMGILAAAAVGIIVTYSASSWCHIASPAGCTR